MGSLLDDLAGLTGTVGVPAASDGPHDGGQASAAHADADADAPGDDGRRTGHPEGLPLRGPGLRYLLSLLLREAGELTVAQLVRRVDAAGYQIVGRASKTVSDALRWEIARGRAVRVGRGRYRAGRIPRTTLRRMQRTLDDLLAAWRSAVAAGGDLTFWTTPAARPRRPVGTPPTGLDRYRRQQRARRDREATFGPRATWRPWAAPPAQPALPLLA